MGKRFTDTEKYKKLFIRNLPAPYKLFWDYLYHDCNHAGIWQVDFEIAQICIGKDAPIKKDEALSLFNADEERILILNGGTKWFLKPFIEFQYGILNPANRVHQSIISILERYNIKGLARGLQGAKDKDKDQDKDQDKEKDKEGDKYGTLENVKLTEIEYKKLIEDYGLSYTKQYIEKLSVYIPNKPKPPYRDHNAVIRTWLNKDKIEKKSKDVSAETPLKEKEYEMLWE